MDNNQQQHAHSAYDDMILPLELLGQAVLTYETFKALKAAPPPRKRRNANTSADGNGEAAPRQTAYAANKRKRAMKVMLRAWLIYATSILLEKVLVYSIGWFLPFYSSFRTLAVVAFITYHKTAGDIGYSHFLVPFLKPREPSLDWIFAWVNEVLDVTCYIVTLITKQIFLLASIALSPFWQGYALVKNFYFSSRAMFIGINEEQANVHHEDTSLSSSLNANGSAKTPRRTKRSNKPRYSQIATPYVPGHLVADESVYPPVQPRLHPAERSADDLPAFQEAMDRAQAAFYEVGSPPPVPQEEATRRAKTLHADNPFLPVPSHTRKTRSKRKEIVPDNTRSHPEKHFARTVSLNDRSQMPPVETPAIPPSSKALGKRRQVTEESEVQGSADASSPDKIAKVGSFDQSRDTKAKANGHAANGANGSRSRPARPRTQASSKLPTRQATRIKEKMPQGSGISIEAQKAREAAIRARRQTDRSAR